jgi:hypothetical protein
MHTVSWKLLTWSLASFGAAMFLSCVIYGLLVPASLHMTTFLEVTLPGFHWITPGTVVIGLVESFLYGAYAGLVYAPIHNFFVRRFVASSGR